MDCKIKQGNRKRDDTKRKDKKKCLLFIVISSRVFLVKTEQNSSTSKKTIFILAFLLLSVACAKPASLRLCLCPALHRSIKPTLSSGNASIRIAEFFFRFCFALVYCLVCLVFPVCMERYKVRAYILFFRHDAPDTRALADRSGRTEWL